MAAGPVSPVESGPRRDFRRGPPHPPNLPLTFILVKQEDPPNALRTPTNMLALHLTNLLTHLLLQNLDAELEAEEEAAETAAKAAAEEEAAEEAERPRSEASCPDNQPLVDALVNHAQEAVVEFGDNQISSLQLTF